VQAVGADPAGELGVGAHQQLQAPGACDGFQPAALSLGVRRAERPEHDRRAARQGRGDRLGVGRPRRIGEEQQVRQPLSPRGGAA